jgi:hypothetical protein
LGKDGTTVRKLLALLLISGLCSLGCSGDTKTGKEKKEKDAKTTGTAPKPKDENGDEKGAKPGDDKEKGGAKEKGEKPGDKKEKDKPTP